MPGGFPLQDTGPGMSELFHDLQVEQEERKSSKKEAGAHVLTIPDQKLAAAAVKSCGGTNGQGDLIKGLAKLPLAISERDASKPWKRMDHIHLGRFDGTDYCQWWGRAGDGFHYPIGRIMQIVEAR